MDVGLLESMVQDGDSKQDIGVQEQELPQPNPEPEMGAATAAVYDTSPSLLRNPPPIPAETAHPSASDMAQLFAMLAEIQSIAQQLGNEIRGMNEKMDTNAQQMKNDMKDEMKKMRGEM